MNRGGVCVCVGGGGLGFLGPGGGGGGWEGGGSRDRQQAPVAINYTAFVKAQLATTGDTREPVAINDIRFIFRDQTNPDAYNNVLAPDN